MNQTKNKISIVIATHNGSKTIGNTIESIEEQIYNNKEIIIINDNSNDETEQIVFGMMKQYNNIRYYKNKKKSERSISRNKGILYSDGDFIAFCDDDDIRSDKDKLGKQMSKLEEGFDFCGTGFVYKKNNQITTGPKIYYSYDEVKNNILTTNSFGLSTLLFRKDVFSEGLFQNKNIGIEDYQLILHLLHRNKGCVIEDNCVIYLLPSSNIRTNHGRKMSLMVLKLIYQHPEYPNFYTSIAKRSYELCLHLFKSFVLGK